MRRSICYCDPATALAGEEKTWTFIYTTALAIPKGAHLKFDLLTKGRDIDWQPPETNLKKQTNIIFAHLDNGKVLQAHEVEVPDSFVPQYEFVLPSEIPAGGNFTITMGAAKGKDDKGGNRAQSNSQRRRPFLLYIDPLGKGNYEDPEVFSLDIKGSQLHRINVITPSFVAKNKRFDVIVRFEDQYGNLTNNAPDDTLIELSYEHLRENLTWKLFVPETGFISLPNLYFNEPGVYTIQLRNPKTKEAFRSPPIKCFAENNKHLYWGLLHGESERYDSTENIENCLRHFRDEKALNFFALSPFESQEETSNETWKTIIQTSAEFDEDERFTTLIGFQWQGEPLEEGLRQIFYAKDQKQLLRKKDIKNSNLKKIYKSFAPKELISIPCFTMGKGFEYDFKNFAPEYERVVEIYNSWGSSECTAKEGNPRPITSTGKEGIKESAEGSIQKALQNNHRFGFVAGGLDDRGIYADFYQGDQVQYHPGFTAIIATEHSRHALFEAVYNRSCYATTGERMILGLYLAGSPMGSEVNTANKPGLLINRHLSGYAVGTTDLASVEIIRNGKVIKTFEQEGYSFNFFYDDMIALEKIALEGQNKQPPFVYYYLRVTQQDGHMAWSSPIWVDLLPPNSTKGEGRRAIASKTTKKAIVVEDFEEEDEEDELDNFDDFDDEEDDEE